MKEPIVEVRRLCHDEEQPWIVDILKEHTAIGGYGQPNGTKGSCYEYKNKADAEAAAVLYLTKNMGRILEVETSAEGKKDTNPKDALGIKKVPTHCIPSGPLLELGLAMMEGGRKYGTHNYRAMGVRYSTYYDAIDRHLKAWWEGEDTDPDSGIHPLIKIMGCCVVIRDSMLMGNDEDDRPIKYPNGLDMAKFNELASDIIKKYPDCKEPFLESTRFPDRAKPVSGGY